MHLEDKVDERSGEDERPQHLAEVALGDDDARQAVRRRVGEELGRDLPDGRLLCSRRRGRRLPALTCSSRRHGCFPQRFLVCQVEMFVAKWLACLGVLWNSG